MQNIKKKTIQFPTRLELLMSLPEKRGGVELHNKVATALQRILQQILSDDNSNCSSHQIDAPEDDYVISILHALGYKVTARYLNNEPHSRVIIVNYGRRGETDEDEWDGSDDKLLPYYGRNESK